MHPDLALDLIRVRRAEVARAARLWVRDHPRALGPTPASRPPGRRTGLLGRAHRAVTHWGTGRTGVAPAGPG